MAQAAVKVPLRTSSELESLQPPSAAIRRMTSLMLSPDRRIHAAIAMIPGSRPWGPNQMV